MLVIILICGLCLIYYLRKEIRPKDAPPPYPGKTPIIGHVYQAFGPDGKNILNFLRDTSKFCIENDTIVSIYLGPLTMYLVSDADDCMTIANNFLQKSSLYKFAKTWLGNGLVTASADEWKYHRKVLNTAFNQQVLDGFIPIFNYQARRMCNELKSAVDDDPIDIGKYLQRSSLETIYLTATGLDLSNEKNLNVRYIEAIESVLEIIVNRLSKVWLYLESVWNISSMKKRMDKKIEFLDDVYNMIIEKRKESDIFPDLIRISGRNLRTFSDVLFKLEEADGSKIFTDQYVKDHINTLIVAGYDTVALSLLHTFLLIASYPRVKDKIQKELDEVLGNSDRDVTKEDLSRLVYLEAVIKESIRLYPVAPFTARSIERDIKIRDHTLYAGNTCILSVYGINRHPMWGPDANEFVPERWLDPSRLPTNTNYFASFGFGKRNCIGRTYSMMWMKILLSHVLRQYEVYGDHTNIVHMFYVLLKPVSGHLITIKNRNI